VIQDVLEAPDLLALLRIRVPRVTRGLQEIREPQVSRVCLEKLPIRVPRVLQVGRDAWVLKVSLALLVILDLRDLMELLV
jgi:hypothetical protein